MFKFLQHKKTLDKLEEISKGGGGSTSSATANASTDTPQPVTPKNTPFFMTPPMSPPNEAYVNLMESQKTDAKVGGEVSVYDVMPQMLFNQLFVSFDCVLECLTS